MNIKKWVILFFLGSTLLAACTASNQTNANPAETGATLDSLPGNGAPLPMGTKLLLGIFKLEGTPQAVTPEQANALLPLWKAVRSLSQSGTVAPQEIEALYAQIQEILTDEQIQTIEGMELSFVHLREIADELGLQFGNGGRAGTLDPELIQTAQAARQSGQMPPAGIFPGGGAPGGDEGMNPQAMQTAMANRGRQQGLGSGIPPALLDALIELLEAKANA